MLTSVVGWRHDRYRRRQESGGRGALREVRRKRLDLFGSAAGDGFDPEASDLDFVVSFERRDPPGLFDRYFGLKEDLEVLLEAAGLTSLRRTPCSRTRTSQRASQGSGCPLCG